MLVLDGGWERDSREGKTAETRESGDVLLNTFFFLKKF